MRAPLLVHKTLSMNMAKFHPVESSDRFDDRDAIGDTCDSGSSDMDEESVPLDQGQESSPWSMTLEDFDAKSPSSPGRKAAFAFLVCAVLVAVSAAKGVPRFWAKDNNNNGIFHQMDEVNEAEGTTNDVRSSQKPIHIVYSSDDESLAGVEASIRSVRAHASGPVIVHFIGDTPLTDMPDVHFKPLSHVARKYHLDDYMNAEYERGHGQAGLNTNKANYVRFAIDKFLPKQTKAMWIDADTIVTCDVVTLVNGVLNDDKNVIAAVPREGPLQGLTKEGDREFAYIATSFNAGIYVINLDNWRAQGISEKIRQVAMRNRETLLYKNGSQPPMAIAIEDRFEHLPPTWNVAMADVEEVTDQFLEETCLMHWNGPFKPWNKKNKKDYYLELWLPYGNQVDRRESQHNHLRRAVLEVESMAL